jgi:hypothetical protein
VIQAHRRHVVELMQQWTRLKRDATEDDVNLILVVDAELFRLDSVIRWLDAADSRLRRAVPTTPDTAPVEPVRRPHPTKPREGAKR